MNNQTLMKSMNPFFIQLADQGYLLDAVVRKGI